MWRGALVLADFFLHQKDVFKGTIALELGSGVGLVSIVASQYCKTIIFCTGELEYEMVTLKHFF